MKENIVIASDHGGYDLKRILIEYLEESGYRTIDLGTNSNQSCDYPVFAKKLCTEIQNKTAQRGILICGTGLGMQICANKFKGIRAVCVSETYSAKMSREHNNSNVLCLGARVLGEGSAKDITDIWLKSEFLGQRHQKRLDMISSFEK